MERAILFFKIFNPDLKNLNKNKIIGLINSNKAYENRIIREEEFYIRYPYFDPDFYQKSYRDLKTLDYINLLRHYHFHGFKEKRICSRNNIKELIEEVNVDKKLLKFLDMEDSTKVEIYSKYKNIFNLSNLKKSIVKWRDFDFNFYKRFYQIDKCVEHFNLNHENIISEEFFQRIHPNYDEKNFYIFNKELIDLEAKKKNIEIDFTTLMYLYNYFSEKGYDFIKSTKDFIEKNNSLSREVFNRFNPEYSHIDDFKFISYYFNNTENLIFSTADFYKKYALFDKKIFKLFNPNYKDEQKGLIDYHIQYNKKRLIGCMNDFYHLFPTKRNFTQEEAINYCKQIEKIGEKPKILIIYVYYERKNETKNQTNLLYFLKHGLDDNSWKEYDITTLLIVNDNLCELIIPKMNNLIVWKRKYHGEYDIGTYKLGIEYMEKKHNDKIFNCYSHLMILNGSVSGPFMNANEQYHWIEPFIEKMEIEDSVVCSPIINFLKDNDAGGPGPRCQTYCSLIRLTEDIYNLLLNTPIVNVCSGSKNKDYELEEACVLQKHTKHHNIILIGEYGFTRVLLEAGYKISCLLYDNINYLDERNWSKYSDRVDRFENFKDDDFEKCIFIKNNWRVNKELRDSFPVSIEKTNYYINKYLNMKSIYNLQVDYDYDLLDIEEKGYILDNCSKIQIWNDKMDFYHKFGKAEEFILWPKKKENNCVAIYCHYDKDNIVKDYVIQGLKTLMILGYDIVFCTTSKKILNVDLPFEINYFKNKKNMTAGNDLFMFYECISKKNLNYEWVLLINDSILFPIHGVEEMGRIIHEKRCSSDFWGLNYSDETREDKLIINHLCSAFIEFNRKCMDKLLEFYDENIKSCENTVDVINNIERRQTKFLIDNNFKMDCVISYQEIVDLKHSKMFNPINSLKYMNNKKCFGIKWKYMGNYINFSKTNNSYLNYLVRFLKVSSNKIIQDIPNYFKGYSDELFDWKFYINFYEDLSHLNKQEAIEHFEKYGKKEQRIKCKSIIKDFNPNIYKELYNYDNFTDVESTEHYENYGRFEGKIGNIKHLNIETNICIIAHLYHEMLMDEFLDYIQKVKYIFKNVTVIITVKQDSKLETNDNFIVLKVENKGVDVYPFIVSIDHINQNNIPCDYILKIHTKISNNPVNGLYNWRNQLIKPITCLKNLIVIQDIFKKYENIGHISSQNCILPRNYDKDFKYNIKGVEEIISKFSHLEKNYTDFNGGNMFWISKQTIDENLTEQLKSYIYSEVSEGKPPENNLIYKSYIEYTCERLFTGVFCYNKLNFLVNDFESNMNFVEINNNKITGNNLYQPRIFSMHNPKYIISINHL